MSLPADMIDRLIHYTRMYIARCQDEQHEVAAQAEDDPEAWGDAEKLAFIVGNANATSDAESDLRFLESLVGPTTP